ncbi:AAA domain-containing protein [Bacillus atrophaeus]|uniref:AAA domain-containing protein n=1 Tax=Bacillus atrophaeus TaxID=1452 RepID=UPI002E1EB8FF|nr:AAA domain-containing protein [Bacillus atrophaeus]MED1032303.1 AAA domain-containing protein [Bacillus atrophaeus]MED1119441.1 AAA domain-containing protein [Bacillus atrophaeus]MED1130323.1 AAA domain-containing protein [Bacillus atrophaeus]
MAGVSIEVDNTKYSEQIKEWRLSKRDNAKIIVHITLKSGIKKSEELDRCIITPVREMVINNQERLVLKGNLKANIENAIIYGDKYAVLTFNGSNKKYIYKEIDIEKITLGNAKFKHLIDYFSYIAAVKDKTKNDIPPILEGEIQRMPLRIESALYAYFSKESRSYKDSETLLFPFGLNLSQIQAVQSAFSSQISVIEGPPGTGKTQTILNLITNLVMKGKNAAIVSSNNSAVANVREKMEKAGYDFLLASLGNQDNQKKFFEQLPELPQTIDEWKIENERESELLKSVLSEIESIKELLNLQNRQAVIKQQIKDLETERKYYKQHFESLETMKPKLLPFYKFNNSKILNFMADEVLNNNNRMNFFKKTRYFFYYGLYDFKQLGDSLNKEKMLTQLQYQFYNQKLNELKNELDKINQTLHAKNFDELSNQIQNYSSLIFKNYIHNKQKGVKKENFEHKTYKDAKHFDRFISRYPIILSTAFSLLKSIPDGFLFDYLIIDEASQLELMPGILALGCAKNVIIVGDTKQLPHIPDKNISRGEMGIEPCFDYVDNSILHSILKVYENKIPVTMLKEHYRCHPMIIKFCNEQYYDGQLIPLTKYDEVEDSSIILIKTVKGNHMRFQSGRHNIRELDSLEEATIKEKVFPHDYDDIGFIAPYRAQIKAANRYMREEVIKDTVHKFQGRECDGIIFSTVLDDKGGKKDIEFVDSATLINVAISRAKKRFVLVSAVDIFKRSNKEISELIRYMEYYTEASLYHESQVISVFDLLYKEFSEVLIQRENKLRDSDSKHKSERIIASLLRDILKEEAYKKIQFRREYRLKDLFNDTSHLNKEEQKFVKTVARFDFLLYYKMGNEPAGVIEVDGIAYHHSDDQVRRDKLKDSILKKSGIPFIRLKTNESGEAERIKGLLNCILKINELKNH